MATPEVLQANLKETVKQYEGKLAALSALNSALQKECDQLRDELDEALQPKTEAELDALELKEEFARRLGEQQRTIDILKDTNQKLQAKVRDAAADGSAAETQLAVLQEKYAKQQQECSQLSARVSELEKGSRRLNHRVKEVENERDKYASRAEVLEIQLAEAQQVIASEEQTAALKVQILQQQHQEQLASAERQLAEAQQELQQQLQVAEHAAAAGSEQAAAAAAEREAMLSAALADARAAVQTYQDQQAETEQRHRKALQRLQAQVRQLESEKQNFLSDSGSANTSLMRQIQSLAAQLSAAQSNAADQEQLLLARLRAAEQAAAATAAAERDASGQAAAAEAALGAAKEAAAAAVQESVQLRSRLESAQRHSKTLEAERNAAQDRLAAAQAREHGLQQELQRCEHLYQKQLYEAQQSIQQASRDKLALQQQLKELQQQYQELQQQQAQQDAAQLLSHVQQQTHSLQNLAIDNNSNSTVQQQDLFAHQRSSSSTNGLLQSIGLSHVVSKDSVSQSSGQSTPLAGLDSFQQSKQPHQQQIWSRTSSGTANHVTSVAEGAELLQLQRLVQQQQQELAAAVRERDAAAEELYQAIRQADAAGGALQEAAQLRLQQQELEKKLEVAMEIIGERTLRIEELEADILDMKSIFHAQLEEAVAQLHAVANGSVHCGSSSTNEGQHNREE